MPKESVLKGFKGRARYEKFKEIIFEIVTKRQNIPAYLLSQELGANEQYIKGHMADEKLSPVKMAIQDLIAEGKIEMYTRGKTHLCFKLPGALKKENLLSVAKNKLPEPCYWTSYYGEAAALLYFNFQIVHIKKQFFPDSKERVCWGFSITEDLQTHVKAYLAHSLNVDPLAFVNTLKILKEKTNAFFNSKVI